MSRGRNALRPLMEAKLTPFDVLAVIGTACLFRYGFGYDQLAALGIGALSWANGLVLGGGMEWRR